MILNDKVSSITYNPLLQCMGIDTWCSRERQQFDTVIEYYSIPWLNSAGQQLGEFIADANPNPQWHAAEKHLFKAIAFALQAQRETLPPQTLQFDYSFRRNLIDYQKVLLLGSAVTQHALGNEISFYAVRGQTCVLPKGVAYINFSLNDLLLKPLLKKQVWLELQNLVE